MKKHGILFCVLSIVFGACQANQTPAPADTPTAARPAATQLAPSPITPQSADATSMPAEQPATQAADIIGVWQLISKPNQPNPDYWLFRENGTYTIASNPDGGAGLSGRYWFEDGYFYTTDDFCPTPGQYKAQIAQPAGQAKKLSFIPAADACQNRIKEYPAAEITWFGRLRPTKTPSPTPATSPTPTPTSIAITIAKDIPYTSELKLDVYAPGAPGPWPVVVVYHGGNVTKTSTAGLSRAIAGRGAVVFTPTWHSSQPSPDDVENGTIGQGFEDAACAVRFARKSAPEYGGDPARIVAIGHSAGGPAAAVMALAGDNFKGDCLIHEGSALADAFVGLEGAYNLPLYVQKSVYELAAPEVWAEISAYTYINQQPIRKDMVIQIVVGSTEELIADGEALYKALKAAGYSPLFTEFPGVDHMSIASAREDILRTIMAAIQKTSEVAPTP
jgi:acetyl esterase/lipase